MHLYIFNYKFFKKGVYKTDLYKVNKNGKKIAFIRTVTFKCNRYTKAFDQYEANIQTFKKASRKTYYKLFKRLKEHHNSKVVRTKA